VLLPFALLAAVTALQIVPLPDGLVSALAPGNSEAWSRSLSPLREAGPEVHPISVAPLATRIELLRLFIYGCTFLASLRVAIEHGGRGFLETLVVGSAVVIALATLGHAAVHADRVFGIYRPREQVGFLAGRVGPLLNPNHVAAYSNVGAFVAAGVALRDRALTMRASAIAAVVLLAGTSVWAGSRGGTGSLLLGAVLVAFLGIYVRMRPRSRSRGGAQVAIVLVALLATGAFLGIAFSDVARTDLAGRDVGKIEIARQAFRLVALSPIVGIGRGSFETMFPLVREGTSYFTFVRAENIVAQWIIEWGVPFAVVAFGALAWSLRPMKLFDGERPPIGPWVALVTTVMHDLFDFHLDVPAVAIIASVCLAVVVSRRDTNERQSTRRPVRWRVRHVAFAVPIGTVIAALVAIPAVGHSVSAERDAIADGAMDPSKDDAAFRREIRASMLRYPAEPFLPLAGAIRAQRTGEESVIPWIGRALARYPHFGRAHLVLARSLAARHRAQARLEYRLAYFDDVNLRPAVLREIPFIVDDRDSALELVPDGTLGDSMLEALASALTDRLPATVVQLDGELLRRDPEATGPLRRQISAALSDAAHQHVWCQDKAVCVGGARTAADSLVAREGDRCESHVLRARLLVVAGSTADALEGLSREVAKVADRASCLRQLVTMCLEVGDRRRADAALDLTLASGCGTRDECLDLYIWAARTEQARGSYVRALSFYKRAADLAPENDDHLVRVAELATTAGLTAEAIDAYGKLAARHPEEPKWRRRADELRAKAMEPRLPR
jgi:tetratricopeptide (TPR) repeat protein